MKGPFCFLRCEYLSSMRRGLLFPQILETLINEGGVSYTMDLVLMFLSYYISILN